MTHGGEEAALRLAGGVGEFLGAHQRSQEILLRRHIGVSAEHFCRTRFEFACRHHRPETLAVGAYEFKLFAEGVAFGDGLTGFLIGGVPVGVAGEQGAG